MKEEVPQHLLISKNHSSNTPQKESQKFEEDKMYQTTDRRNGGPKLMEPTP